MKRLLLLLALVAGIAAFTAGAGGAALGDWVISFSASDSTALPAGGGTVHFTGTVSSTVYTGAPGAGVYFFWAKTYADSTCTGDGTLVATTTADEFGAFAFAVAFGATPGTYYVGVTSDLPDSVSTGCVTVTVAEPAPVGEPTITLTATPSAVTAPGDVTLSGVYTPVGEESAVGVPVYLFQYDDAQCTTWSTTLYDRETETVAGGVYSETVAGLPAGTYWYQAETETAVSDCVQVTVAAAPVTIPSDEQASSYLCWNKEMVNPVAYIDKTADAMWKTGNYFEPQAVLGNVVGGTNIGAYHLVCNASGTLKQTDMAVGGSGEVYDAIAAAQYHKEHPGGNDLNIYHIWK